MSTHAVSARWYLLICAILLALTWLTVVVAFRDLGVMNTVAALAIASAKAMLVILYFMHARYNPRLIWAVVAASVLFLFILLTLTLADYLTRGWVG
jgi:cytochrome c oxidase subunit IV